ncbi:MAG: transposase, partial [Chloroflexota bacterium]
FSCNRGFIREINQLRNEKYPPIWQGKFYDRIVRSNQELEAVRSYIQHNPITWKQDQEWEDDIDVNLAF